MCYGLLSERTPVLMPFWITYVYFAQRWFFRDSVIRYVLTIMAPFAICFSLLFILGLEDRTSIFYDLFTLENYRLYSVPAISFNVHYNYLTDHPFTCWSHIGLISNFVDRCAAWPGTAHQWSGVDVRDPAACTARGSVEPALPETVATGLVA